MSKLWKGPCAELKADYDDLLARRLHRRASRLLISYRAEHDGRSAQVFRIEERRDGWYQIPIGVAYGGDVPNLWLNIHLAHTPLDAELFEIASTMILRRAESCLDRIADLRKGIETQLDDLAETMQHVRA